MSRDRRVAFGRKQVAQRLVAKIDDEFEALRPADLAALQLPGRDIMVRRIDHLDGPQATAGQDAISPGPISLEYERSARQISSRPITANAPLIKHMRLKQIADPVAGKPGYSATELCAADPHLIMKRERAERTRAVRKPLERPCKVTPKMRIEGDHRLISILVPVYNEEGNIRRAYETVRDTFDLLKDRYTFEIIFTDNHSTDGSFAIITELARSDTRVRGVRFARNFGFQRSVLTAYRLASGDAAIQLDCDLQDPPSLFPQFLELWEQGHDVVVGIRQVRHEGRLLQWLRRFYYRLLKRVSDDNLMLDSGDFRLIDRSVLDQLHLINDVAPYTRGLTSMLATRQTGVPYDREVRQSGESKFPVGKLVALAVTG